MGGRQQQVSLNANDAINPASYASGSKSRMLRAYEVGARHEIDRNLSFYGRIGTSFRIPTMDEVYNQYGGPVFDSIVTLLEPQTSHDREVGMDVHSGASSLHAALYEMDLVNEIYYSALTFSNINLSPTRRYGLELEGRTRIAPSLESYASYTYAVAKFREGVYNGVNVAGNTVPLVPRQSATLGLAWSLAEKTKLDGVVKYVGRQYFDNDQSNTFGMQMPAYFTADMKLTREVADWTVTAAVDNLFNRSYFTYAVASTFTPGAYSAYPMRERAFMVGAQYKFK
jgi:iron complex outermembrane receptor protein